MIRAYSESYLDDAMDNLGEAFEYATIACHLTLDEFMELFISSGYADRFGRGEPKLVAGLSGTELVMDILTITGNQTDFPDALTSYNLPMEYWCGWILAYYQWKTSKSFKEIHDKIPMTEIAKLYPTLHEAPEEKFADTFDIIIQRKEQEHGTDH